MERKVRREKKEQIDLLNKDQMKTRKIERKRQITNKTDALDSIDYEAIYPLSEEEFKIDNLARSSLDKILEKASSTTLKRIQRAHF